MPDEKGYIQFACVWERAAPPAGPVVEALRRWRDRLYRLGLIGVYPDGVGYGNLSGRASGGRSFLITGSGTGCFPTLAPAHFTEVTSWDVARNTLWCRGPVRASSESLSHAAVYRSASEVRAAMHVHHLGLWQRLYGRLPTTDPQALAGTPEMAWAIEALFREGAVREEKLFVMGGHREGLMAFGASADEAGQRVLAALKCA